ncbi:MAG: hypothetical protein ABFS46_12675 [Myxococcota bacterium]
MSSARRPEALPTEADSMPDPNDYAPTTQLRRSYQRARTLHPAEQIRECVDQLEHPEIVVAETLDAFCTISDWVGSRELTPPGAPLDMDAIDLEELGREFFYATREIAVVGEPCAFTSLASNLDPLSELRPPSKGERDGLDYVGLTCDGTRTPVLGTVESQLDTSAYPLLLRSLACLAEMAPQAQVERMDRQFFMGGLGLRPAFDLNLVVWDHTAGDERTTLDQLTRDLAEKVKRAIHEHARFPEILRDIVCLRMNPARFDGRLRFVWRI